MERPNFQRGEKVRQRAFASRASLACCWDRRHAIELIRRIVGDSREPCARTVDEATVRKCVEFLEEIDQ